MHKIIYIDPDEEVISVVDRLKKTKEEYIAIVAPSGSVLLSGVINLKLLREEAKLLHKRIALVTQDSSGRNIAANLGYAVYETVSDAEEFEQEKAAKPVKRIENNHVEIRAEEYIDEDESIQPEPQQDDFSQKRSEMREERTRAKGDAFDELFIQKKSYDAYQPSNPQKSAAAVFVNRQKNSSPYRTMQKISKKASFRLPLILGGLGVLVIGFFLAAFIFPSATISLNVVTEKKEISIPFLVGEEYKSITRDAQFSIPGQWQTQEKEISVSQPTTGQKNVGDKAKGYIVVYNRSGKNYAFPANSQLVSSEGKVFHNLAAITIPGALVSDFGELIPGKVSFDVEAESGGVASNIKPGKFTIPEFADQSNLVYGISEEPMQGGTDRQAKVATDEDVKSVKDKAQEEAKNKIQEELGLKGDTVFVKGLTKIDIIAENTSLEKDGEGDQITATTKAQFSYLIFNRKDFDQIFSDSLNLSLSKDMAATGKGYEEVNWDVKKFDPDKKSAEVLAKVKVRVGAKLDENFLKSRFGGLGISEVRSELYRYPNVELDGISFFPPFMCC